MGRSKHSRRGANHKSQKWLLSISALAVLFVAFGSLAPGSIIFVNGKMSQLAAAVFETTSKNCETAKQVAAKGVFSGSQSGTGSSIADKCIAAVFDQSKVQPNEQYPRQNPKNYKCVGKAVRVSIDTRGKVTESWSAAVGVPQDICSTQYCDMKGCKPAQQMSGINSAAEAGQQSGQLSQMPEIPKAQQTEQAQQQNQPTRNWPECQAFGTCVAQALNDSLSKSQSPPTENKPWSDRAWDAIQRLAGIEPAIAPIASELTEARPEDIQRWQGLENPTALAPDYASKGSDSIPHPSPAYNDTTANSTFGQPLSEQEINQRLQDRGISARERGYTNLIDAPYLIRDGFQYLWSRLRSLF